MYIYIYCNKFNISIIINNNIIQDSIYEFEYQYI